MTYERFKQLWIKAGLNDLPKIEDPIMVDQMSDHTINALIKASDGDFSEFDKIEEILNERDNDTRT